MQMFSVYSSKGGSGKTTITLSLLSFLLYNDETVTLIDLDPQESSCGIAAGWGGPIVYCGKPDEKPVTDFVLFDYPPGTKNLPNTKNVILPILPGVLDIKAAMKTINALDKRQNLFVILNCYDKRRKDDIQVFQKLNKKIDNLFTVCNRSVYRRTLTQGKSIFSGGLKKIGGLSQAQNEIGYIADQIFYS
jgi:cellulose biosynthesis protein BcsQ